ncbi:MAG: VOC family protein [Oscillospiraceae bacterium]|nr:VOC family protein [Oscillospiraceae bacterium]
MFDHYQGLAHIAIRTLDVEKSIEFYEKIGGKVVIADILGTDKGDKLMAMVDFAGITIELIQVFEPVEAGIIPHFAIYVDNLLDVVMEIAATGITSFPTKRIQRLKVFDGMTNWILYGPSGEEIEFVQLEVEQLLELKQKREEQELFEQFKRQLEQGQIK